jgi:hypothetical protein
MKKKLRRPGTLRLICKLIVQLIGVTVGINISIHYIAAPNPPRDDFSAMSVSS